MLKRDKNSLVGTNSYCSLFYAQLWDRPHEEQALQVIKIQFGNHSLIPEEPTDLGADQHWLQTPQRKRQPRLGEPPRKEIQLLQSSLVKKLHLDLIRL